MSYIFGKPHENVLPLSEIHALEVREENTLIITKKDGEHLIFQVQRAEVFKKAYETWLSGGIVDVQHSRRTYTLLYDPIFVEGNAVYYNGKVTPIPEMTDLKLISYDKIQFFSGDGKKFTIKMKHAREIYHEIQNQQQKTARNLNYGKTLTSADISVTAHMLGMIGLVFFFLIIFMIALYTVDDIQRIQRIRNLGDIVIALTVWGYFTRNRQVVLKENVLFTPQRLAVWLLDIEDMSVQSGKLVLKVTGHEKPISIGVLSPETLLHDIQKQQAFLNQHGYQ